MSKRAPETNLLIAELKRCYEEETIALYEKLEGIVGQIRKGNRSYLVAALNAVQVEYGYLFKCIPTIGYAPVPNKNKVEMIEQRRLSKIKSQVSKFEEELNCVESGELNLHERQHFYSAQMRLSCHQMILSEKLDESYKMAGQRCVSTGKIEFDEDDMKQSIRALLL
jgi:hypothetical protein